MFGSLRGPEAPPRLVEDVERGEDPREDLAEHAVLVLGNRDEVAKTSKRNLSRARVFVITHGVVILGRSIGVSTYLTTVPA